MELRTFPVDVLEQLIGRAIVEMGVGGYVSTDDIVRIFNPISATEFAQIVYATDSMMSLVLTDGIPDHEKAREATKAENIAHFIEQNQFEKRLCFVGLVELFETAVGQQVRAKFL